MKKFLGLLFIAFLAIPLLPADQASAAPAPELTDVQIFGVTSDAAGYVWEDINFNQQSAVNPMGGETGYLAVYVEGTMQQGTFRVFNNGNNITSQTFKALDDEDVTDSGNNVIGTIKYIGFPLSAVSSGRFTISANNYYPPNNTLYENLYIEVE
ncbi:DUF4879 domain-containing protein [Sediminibacillus albus]|uniref:DUF4879 domain-containing protein n=1 Tax=Sediminibacillus albus TaxID=407036 RepID=A0A1G9BAZ3_9BACI|nr:DUF4879 domain-containing protein [Sediminibacillus albus]SDK36224.1 protein of unknown function [Sediminibacillus albus]